MIVPRFGVVVLNWNNAQDTISCLEALLGLTMLPACVVVVDNGSVDGSADAIGHWIAARRLPDGTGSVPWLTLLRAGSNKGFAGGTNIGLRYLVERTDVTHLLLLNNDATLSANFFDTLVAILEERPDSGLIGPTIFEGEAEQKVWYAGGVEIPVRALYKHLHEVPASHTPVPTDFVTGCAMVISRELTESIGLLPECYYPAYWEDGEYSFRARQAGFPVLYAPAAKAYHKVGGTVRYADIDLELARAKNRLRVFYVRRNYRGFKKAVALGYLAVTKPGRAIVEALSGRAAHGNAILTGTLAGFFDSPFVGEEKPDQRKSPASQPVR